MKISMATRFILGVQGALLLIELFTRYDSWDRQLALAVTNIAGVVAILLLSRYFRRHGSELPFVASAALALGVWFDAAGNFAHLYSRFSWWDQLAHGVGSAAVAVAVWYVLALMAKQGRLGVSKGWRSLITISLTTTLACVYEMSEYLGDLWFQTHRVTDLYDTADDMLWNTLAVLLVVWLAARRKNQ
jgi:hypothetical protein